VARPAADVVDFAAFDERGETVEQRPVERFAVEFARDMAGVFVGQVVLTAAVGFTILVLFYVILAGTAVLILQQKPAPKVAGQVDYFCCFLRFYRE
jgi:hypothetical protein